MTAMVTALTFNSHQTNNQGNFLSLAQEIRFISH